MSSPISDKNFDDSKSSKRKVILGSDKVTLLSGTYFVSANLYSSDTYLIIYDTLNDILTKHFRRKCHDSDFAIEIWVFTTAG